MLPGFSTAIVLLAAYTTLASAFLRSPSILTSKKGVFCSNIQVSPSHPGKSYIKLHPEHASADFKIPGLIFYYPDIVNFTSVPIVEEFSRLCPKDKEVLFKKILNQDDGTFILDAADGYDVDKSKLWSGIVDKDVKFQVDHSGFYCVYVAPPVEDKDPFEIPIVFKNYYGNLSYPFYLIYAQSKFTIAVAIIVFASLFNYILKFKVGDNFQHLDSISVISKAVIFLVLAPFTLLSMYQWFVLFLINNFLETCQRSRIISFLLLLSQFGETTFTTFLKYAVLLFSMGFGVIYYHSGNSHNYRQFPRDSFFKVTAFFVATLVVQFASHVRLANSASDTPIIGYHGQTLLNQYGTLTAFLLGLAGLLSMAWFILSMIFYFKTKKTIAAFPPASDADSTEKVVSAFRKSFVVIYILPIVTSIFGGIVAGVMTAQSFKNMPDYPTRTERDPVYQSALGMWMLEKSMAKFMIPVLWSTWFYFFSLIISLFFLWIKDNNGLIVDPNANDPIEYADVPNFNISDEEEEQEQEQGQGQGQDIRV
ncbi:uncharacterized protein LODBEIA_P36460 [Lodderomyces beijingensis]|uniref:Membrane protein PTM1 n=1 Tax=Lodderomyces beijingensis TaxID=1775926 RepID=A0ABP0ZT12_9ASCO